MVKLNCWEAEECGRQPGGIRSQEFGVCPVTTETRASGINSGINAGRACWAIAGTLCGGEKQGNYTQKLKKCLDCSFFNKVRQEEGAAFINSQKILNSVYKN